MRNSELIKQAIDDGLAGKNTGISMGSDKLNLFTGGLQYGRYDLIGGTTGSSKTAFVDNFYVLKPWFMLNQMRKRGLTDRSIKCFYWSLEIRKVRKLAKWISWIIFQEQRILIDSRTILTLIVDEGQLQENRMSTEMYQLIMSKLHLLDEMEDDIHIIENKVSPDGIYASFKSYAEAHGHKTTIPVTDKDGHFLHNKEIYVPTNPRELVFGVVDHAGLLKANKDAENKKGTLDTMSAFFVSLRNQYNYSFVAVNQFNRELADVNRQRFKELTPQMEDFKDTGNSQEDAEVVIALFNPVIYNMDSYSDYNIRRLGPKFRGVSILKNRDGTAPVRIGYHFEGACGGYRELPKGIEMNEQEYNLTLTDWPKDVRRDGSQTTLI